MSLASPTSKQLRYLAALALELGHELRPYVVLCQGKDPPLWTADKIGEAIDKALLSLGRRQLDLASEGRTWLTVRYAERKRARQLGAKWDSGAKGWYARPGADLGAFYDAGFLKTRPADGRLTVAPAAIARTTG